MPEYVQLELDLRIQNYRGSGRKSAKLLNLEKAVLQAQKKWWEQLLMTDQEFLRQMLSVLRRNNNESKKYEQLSKDLSKNPAKDRNRN
ncbi:hypothetical protein [Okeania sp. SIO2B3]|uniref:hypothetical protein n=1 Tax=Okeania sp. SIO2B3 TaxID=2607784 RepID=UPI0013BF2DEB|nr:hypothetical protein [Okeania sp. SIO2B3]NET44863.1 hypothetical protein [Okeania sp. SIO2B3]